MRTYRTVRYPLGEALLALYRWRGPLINAGVGGHGYTYLLGAEANRFVFANADAFSWSQTFESLVPVDGPTALIVSDGADPGAAAVWWHRGCGTITSSAMWQRWCPISTR